MRRCIDTTLLAAIGCLASVAPLGGCIDSPEFVASDAVATSDATTEPDGDEPGVDAAPDSVVDAAVDAPDPDALDEGRDDAEVPVQDVIAAPCETDCAALDDPASCTAGACVDGSCVAGPAPQGTPCSVSLCAGSVWTPPSTCDGAMGSAHCVPADGVDCSLEGCLAGGCEDHSGCHVGVSQSVYSDSCDQLDGAWDLVTVRNVEHELFTEHRTFQWSGGAATGLGVSIGQEPHQVLELTDTALEQRWLGVAGATADFMVFSQVMYSGSSYSQGGVAVAVRSAPLAEGALMGSWRAYVLSPGFDDAGFEMRHADLHIGANGCMQAAASVIATDGAFPEGDGTLSPSCLVEEPAGSGRLIFDHDITAEGGKYADTWELWTGMGGRLAVGTSEGSAFGPDAGFVLLVKRGEPQLPALSGAYWNSHVSVEELVGGRSIYGTLALSDGTVETATISLESGGLPAEHLVLSGTFDVDPETAAFAAQYETFGSYQAQFEGVAAGGDETFGLIPLVVAHNLPVPNAFDPDPSFVGSLVLMAWRAAP